MRNYPKNGIVWTVNTQQGRKLSQEQQILVMWTTLAPTAYSGYDAASHWARMSAEFFSTYCPRKSLLGLVNEMKPMFYLQPSMCCKRHKMLPVSSHSPNYSFEALNVYANIILCKKKLFYFRQLTILWAEWSSANEDTCFGWSNFNLTIFSMK